VIYLACKPLEAALPCCEPPETTPICCESLVEVTYRPHYANLHG